VQRVELRVNIVAVGSEANEELSGQTAASMAHPGLEVPDSRAQNAIRLLEHLWESHHSCLGLDEDWV
jgi:hypothetical protein